KMISYYICDYFFFSSRRRHTRSKRDWSSDVCSSDLLMTTNKYSVVPVIDEKSKIKGLISMPIIIEAIMDIEDVRFDKLGDIKVEEIMDTDFPVVTMDFELEDIL